MEHISQTLNQLKPQVYESSVDEDTPQVDKSSWLSDSGISLRYRDKSFVNFETDKGNKLALDKCQEYVEGFPLARPINYHSLGLFSKGVWGVGKTHLVCAIARRLQERCQFMNPVLYMTEPDMLRRVRRTYDHRDGEETEDEVLRKLVGIPLLIIDDVGKEEIADPRFVQRVWFSIINARYDNLRPVIITANLSPDEISYHLGGNKNNEATFDRLYEMLQGVFYEIKGKSYRRKL